MNTWNKVTVTKGNAKHILHQVANALGHSSSEDCQRDSIALPGPGGGELISYEGTDGMSAFIVHVKEDIDWTLRITGKAEDPIAFYVAARGEMRIRSEHLSFNVLPLQSTIHGGFGNDTSHSVRFQGEEGGLFMIMMLDKGAFFQQMACDQLAVPKTLLNVIKNVEQIAEGFLFQDLYHLPIVNALQEIVEQETVGLLNSTYSIGKLYEMIYLQINEYKEYEQNKKKRIVRNPEQLQLIRDAEAILTSRLQDPPTIPELARMVGINQQTLKQGFRQLFGDSINQYLNERRLEHACILIRAGKMSLQEIAHEVGYSNPGYFSRRFREKYGMAPRYYNQASNGVRATE